MTYQLDENLRPFANDEQWALMLAIQEHGSARAAAKVLGRDHAHLQRVRRDILRRAAQQGYAPAHDLTHVVPDGLTLRGTSIFYDGEGTIQGYWNKTKVDGRPEPETVQLPDPKTIVRRSTLYDNTGKVTQQWITEKPEEKNRLFLWEETAKAMAAELPRAEPIPAPIVFASDLMNLIPVGDQHLGMHAWHEETGGADYDLKIGEQLLCSAATHLLDNSPRCQRCAIFFMGDFMHYDSFRPETPAHKNLLDADSRFPKMVRVAVRTMRFMIDAALQRNTEVLVVIVKGNHDPASTIWLREMMAAIYEKEPRVKVDVSPRNVHYLQHGKVLLGATHGDKGKLASLPIVMATDVPDLWGTTEYRYIWTAHVHHDQTKDYHGCKVESVRVLPPEDAYAADAMFRSMRDMKSITYHEKYGETSRLTVNPAMFA